MTLSRLCLPPEFVAAPPAVWRLQDVRLGEAGAEAPASDIHMAHGRIVAIEPAGTVRGDTPAIDGRGSLVFPGLVNAHAHSTEQFDQGAWEGEPLEVWLAMAYPPLAPQQVPPRWHYLRAMMLALQSLRGGVTSLHDDFVDPTGDPESLAQVLAAYRDVGVRARVAITLVDRSYLEGLPLAAKHLPAAIGDVLARRPPRDIVAQTRHVQMSVEALQGRDARVGLSLGPRGPQRCTPALLREVARLSERHALPVHMHVLESRAQALAAQHQYGKTFIEVLDDAGLLGPRTALNHAIWLTPDDIERLARSDTRVVHNPLSNFKLASGLCPLKALRAAGVVVGLGTDGAATSDSVDYLDTLRIASLVHTLDATEALPAPRTADVLDMATRGGAATLGDSGEGRVAVGQRADLVLLDATDPAFVPLNDPVRQLCLAAPSRAVRGVIVDGVVVHCEGRATRVDQDRLYDEIAQAAAAHRAERFRPASPDHAALLDGLRRMTADVRQQAEAVGMSPARPLLPPTL